METVVPKIFIILTFLLIVNGHNCSIKVVRDEVLADCRYRNWTEIPDGLPANIQVLDLSRNKITTIRANNSLGNYRNLIRLNLNRNKIIHVHSKGFGNLKNLQELTLSQNFLNISNEDGKEVLRNVKNIIGLDFSRQNFPPGNESNIHSYLKYPDELFGNLHNLQNLSIDLYGYPEFGPGFRKMNLTSIRLDNCYAKFLKNGTFKNFQNSLKQVYLTNCTMLEHIENTQIGIFSPFPNLTTVDLSWTKITVLKGLEMLYVFANNTMDKIDLGHMKNEDVLVNRTVIPYSIILTPALTRYLNTICVKTLILCDNFIGDMLPSTFYSTKMLNCLQYLDLSANRFGFLSLQSDISEMGNHLINLKAFDFSYLLIKFQNEKFLNFPLKDGKKSEQTAYTHIKDEDTIYCKNLISRDLQVTMPQNLSFMRFTHVIGAPVVTKLTLIRASSLKHVDISYYKIRCFPRIIFANSTENNVEYLDVSGIEAWKIYNNQIELLGKLKILIMRDAKFHEAINDDQNILQHVPNLEYLDLSLNGIYKIPKKFLTHLQNLKTLRLYKNHLLYIPNVITDLQNLTFLDMTDNRLHTIYYNFTTWFDSQSRRLGMFKLKIQHNDFSCSCSARDFIRWLNSTRISLDKNRNYKCRLEGSTTENTNYAIKNFHNIYSDCDATLWLHIGVALVSSFLTICLPVAVIYNFRWSIVFVCFRNFRKIVERSMDFSYDFDVFVSYAPEGSPWIKTVLLHHLETKWRLDVCIEDRNFQGGRPHCEQIADSIEKSRYIIFVVTSDFMLKEFVNYEIDRAIVAKSNRTLRQIIIIALDVEIEHIPLDLQAVWRDVSVIEWPTNTDNATSALEKLKTKILLNV